MDKPISLADEVLLLSNVESYNSCISKLNNDLSHNEASLTTYSITGALWKILSTHHKNRNLSSYSHYRNGLFHLILDNWNIVGFLCIHWRRKKEEMPQFALDFCHCKITLIKPLIIYSHLWLNTTGWYSYLLKWHPYIKREKNE